MCGICGFVGEQRGKREDILEDMKEAIRHRGPDDGGSWIKGEAALGFRRLSIIDLACGAQPMENETRDKVLVFNGEIYNYRQLRLELLELGHVFSTSSDTEVLLHGYEQWGEAMLNRLRGMFAFVIWDTREKELFAARDFFGIKPLHYAMIDGNLVFASEIKSILRFPRYERQLNEEALEQFLSFQYSALEETFFKGIYRLQPGTFLRWRVGEAKPRLQTYFEPSLNSREDQSEEEWTEAVDQVLKDSAAAHSIADVEIGVFLSGGVDSGVIASEFPGRRAYTVGFGQEGGRYNEISWARRTAKEYNLKHQGRQICEQEFWEAVPKALYYMDEPLGDASAVALYFLAGEASKDVKVVVSGEGADELFGGYRIYCEPRALRWYQHLPLKLRKVLAKVAERLPNWKGKHFLIRGSKTVEERFIGNANIFSYEERCGLLQNPTKAVSPQEFLEKDYSRTKGMADADRMQDIDLRHWLPGDILQKADRMSMAHSLEVRVPFLDREGVFALARKLPSEMKQRGGTTKYALRRAAARRLDIDTSDRPKLGFPVPIRNWICTEEGQRRLRGAFRSSAAQRYFRREKLEKLLEGHLRGRCDNSRKLWLIYTFCVWYDIYFTAERGGRRDIEIQSKPLHIAERSVKMCAFRCPVRI